MGDTNHLYKIYLKIWVISVIYCIFLICFVIHREGGAYSDKVDKARGGEFFKSRQGLFVTDASMSEAILTREDTKVVTQFTVKVSPILPSVRGQSEQLGLVVLH